MNNLSKEEKLKFILQLQEKCKFTAYEIGRNTELNVSGVDRILKKETKNPQKSTIDIIYNYVYNNYSLTNVNKVNEPESKYDLLSGYDKKIENIEEEIKAREQIITLAENDISKINHQKQMIKLYKEQIELIKEAKKNHNNEK